MTQSDRAAGGYFVVHDKGGHCYDVLGYTSRGELLLHTWHIGLRSMQMECDAWRARGATERRAPAIVTTLAKAT